MFDRLTDKLAQVFKKLKGHGKLTEAQVQEALREVRLALLEADVNYKVAKSFIERVRERAVGEEVMRSLTPAQQVVKIVHEELTGLLGGESPRLDLSGRPPIALMLVGLQGSGKTTTAAKLAHLVQGRGNAAILAACDTFRAAAVEQLKLWGERLKIPVIRGAQGADPAAVAHDAIAAALARRADYLFIDTAGRQHTKHNLMQELQKVHRIMHKKLPGAPHETLLVLDAGTGMNALTQAREFNKAVPLTGLVITKLDGTSKGGMVVAIQKELGLPIKFIGLGEKLEDLHPFDASQFAQALFEE